MHPGRKRDQKGSEESMRFALLPMPDGSKLAVNPNYIIKVTPEAENRSVILVDQGGSHEGIKVSAGCDAVCAIVENAWRDTRPKASSSEGEGDG
jgi:hypothetical protein